MMSFLTQRNPNNNININENSHDNNNNAMIECRSVGDNVFFYSILQLKKKIMPKSDDRNTLDCALDNGDDALTRNIGTTYMYNVVECSNAQAKPKNTICQML